MTWPMVLVTCTLAGLPDTYMVQALELDMETHWLPMNTFVILDTHSGALSGSLQYSGGLHTSRKHATALDVLEAFLGAEFLAAAKKAAEQAHCQPSSPDNCWYKTGAHWQGGWRCLALCTCGPAMTVSSHFEKVRQLVANDVFDVVLGLGGSSTLPMQVEEGISKFVEGVGLNRSAPIWELMCQVIGENRALLRANSAVLVFKDRGPSSRVTVWEISLHNPPWQLLGYQIRACGTEGCIPSPKNLVIKSKEGLKYQATCAECGWRSAWVAEKSTEGLVFPVSPNLNDVFWHSYPPFIQLQGIFVSLINHITVFPVSPNINSVFWHSYPPSVQLQGIFISLIKHIAVMPLDLRMRGRVLVWALTWINAHSMDSNYVSSWSFQTLKSLTEESSEEAWFAACDVIFDVVVEVRTMLPEGLETHPDVRVPNLLIAADMHARSRKEVEEDGSWPNFQAMGQPQSDLTQHQWYRGRSASRQTELLAPMEVVRNEVTVQKVYKGKGKEVVTSGKKRLVWGPSAILTESENESESSQSNHPPSQAPFHPKSSRPIICIPKHAQVVFVFWRDEDDNDVESPPVAASTSSCATCRAKGVECQWTSGDACMWCRKRKVKCSLATKDRRAKGQKSKASIADVNVRDQAPPPANAKETALLHQKRHRVTLPLPLEKSSQSETVEKALPGKGKGVLLTLRHKFVCKTIPPPPPPAAASSTVMDSATATIEKCLKMLELTVESLMRAHEGLRQMVTGEKEGSLDGLQGHSDAEGGEEDGENMDWE
ncbi:hypothetical protein PAXRUDRAFT_28742 [Paxillus rubicundulus Ve08.2h10]|uniref:Zn(2)-C6 fungal-type domain-containing protein n=1 Tax=Paxillus rubicundulus Ve08.2h10 TaxID=930991 RepID=A0A0D0CR42_9AGAM|nr:hypothetical protein PAXRUDRAFT_28742 [Paxillus rubicundulus Ve08.2h10]